MFLAYASGDAKANANCGPALENYSRSIVITNNALEKYLRTSVKSSSTKTMTKAQAKQSSPLNVYTKAVRNQDEARSLVITSCAPSAADKGAQGDRGAAGAQGIAGTSGAAGTNGIDGINGSTGAKGALGPTGNQGLAGAQGSLGPIGLTGETGPTGQAGATGATGRPGTDGGRGVDGNAGPVGEAGTPGPSGEKGDPGENGAAGSAGLAWAGFGINETETMDLTTRENATCDDTDEIEGNVVQVPENAVGTSVAYKLVVSASISGENSNASSSLMGVKLSFDGQLQPALAVTSIPGALESPHNSTSIQAQIVVNAEQANSAHTIKLLACATTSGVVIPANASSMNVVTAGV